MSRNHPPHRRDLMREQLAHQAARLMAEDGITDHAYAKRKAARQLGAADTQHMPSNQEIDEALRSFRALYQRDTHPAALRRLREQALSVMHLLQAFHPWLTGSVLNGTAGEHSDINLEVCSDDEKAVMMLLLKHNIPFESREWKTRLAGGMHTVPSFTLENGCDAPVHIVVLPESARYSISRKADTHADIAALERLMTEGTSAVLPATD